MLPLIALLTLFSSRVGALESSRVSCCSILRASPVLPLIVLTTFIISCVGTHKSIRNQYSSNVTEYAGYYARCQMAWEGPLP